MIRFGAIVVVALALGACGLVFPIQRETPIDGGVDAAAIDGAADVAVEVGPVKPECPLVDLLAGLGDFETGVSAWRAGATAICAGKPCTLSPSADALFGAGSALVCGPPTTTRDSYSMDLSASFRVAAPRNGTYLMRASVKPATGKATPTVSFQVDSLKGTTRTAGVRTNPVTVPATSSCIEASLAFKEPSGDADLLDPILFFQEATQESCILVDNVSLFYLGGAAVIPAGCGCPSR
jgi:hypothetical protein